MVTGKDVREDSFLFQVSVIIFLFMHKQSRGVLCYLNENIQNMKKVLT